MKKSKLLILLAASSVAAVTAVVLAPKANGSKLRASECDHDKYAYHYGYVAATADHVGRKEYWICCECNQVFFEKPDAGTFAEGKDDYFDTKVEHDVLIEAHEHYDVDPVDGHCDHEDCLEEVDYVTGSIIKPSRTIGRGETLHLSSDVKAYGKATSDVYYVVTDINGLASRVTLTDNEDGTADIESSENTGNGVFKGTVSLYAAYDDSLLDSFELATSTYGSSNRTPIKNFFSTTDYHIIPFSFQSSFVNSGTSMKQTISGRDTYKEVVGEYLNQGTWTLVSESDEKTVFTLQDSKDAGVYYEAEITPTSGGAVVNFTLNEHVFTSFPSELVNGILSGKTTSTVIAPETATNYTFTKTSSALTGFTLYVNGGDIAEYLSQLEEAGYYLVKQSNTKYNCVSPDRTLVVSVSSSSGFFSMSFSVQSAPTGATEWPEADQAKMMSYLGEVLPFVDVDCYSWYDYRPNYDYMLSSSNRKEFFPLAVSVFEADSTFTKDSETDYVAVFVKDASDKKQIKVTVNSDGQYKVELIVKPETTWFADEIAEALGSDAKEALPAAVGTAYYYNFDAANHAVSIKVVGDMDAYKSVLAGANYKLQDYDWYGVQGVSPTGTISVTVDYDGYNYDAFIIEANAQMPEGTTLVFPTDAVKGALGVESVPEAEGTLFVFEKGEGSTCSVEVTGSKDAFLASLTEFTEESGVYSNETMNVKLSVEDVDDGVFKINYSTIVVVAGWSEEAKAAIKNLLEGNYVGVTELPYPKTLTSYEVVSYKSIQVYGMNINEYIGQLEEAGLHVYSDEGEYDVYYDDEWYAIYLMVQSDNSVVFKSTYY